MFDPWNLVVLMVPVTWLMMSRSYWRIWHHRLRWWAMPFALGAVLFNVRFERWEVR